MDGIVVICVIIYLVFRVMKAKDKLGIGTSKTTAATKTAASKSSYSAKPAYSKKYSGAMNHRESSAMPHNHRESGVYDSANRHRADNSDGAMPHSHAADRPRHIDVATLPPGYILLNGEPVRTKDLENY